MGKAGLSRRAALWTDTPPSSAARAAQAPLLSMALDGGVKEDDIQVIWTTFRISLLGYSYAKKARTFH